MSQNDANEPTTWAIAHTHTHTKKEVVSITEEQDTTSTLHWLYCNTTSENMDSLNDHRLKLFINPFPVSKRELPLL